MDERPTHIDLCTGIGGFALAARWAGFRTVAFCEKDKFCQKIIAQEFPGIPIEPDLFGFRGRFSNLLTAGFPCQPYSVAGKRKGAADNRAIWPEVLRIVKEGNPDWFLGENVVGLDGMGLDECLSDLESINYEVAPPLEIPACAIGAIHLRPRLWILANSNRNRLQGSLDGVPENQGCGNKYVEVFSPSSFLTRTQNKLPPPYVIGANDGIPDRAHRIKALGNAIVPQVAYQIIKEIRKLICNP